MKLESVEYFDKGYGTTLAHIQLFNPGIDISGVYFDKIVVKGQIVHPPSEEDKENQGSPSNLQVNHQEPEANQQNLEAGHQDIVVEDPNCFLNDNINHDHPDNSEATP